MQQAASATCAVYDGGPWRFSRGAGRNRSGNRPGILQWTFVV